MNILIPDKWLREFLQTKATPSELKEHLSLCGPSIERINKVDNDVVYDVEVTTNRPDSMSIVGVAREAAAILPRFGIQATLVNDPYLLKSTHNSSKAKKSDKKLQIITDPVLNPRWTSVILDHVTVKESPMWLKTYLEQTGIRALNNIVDITNFLMRSYGQPAHAFDYDQIKAGKNGIPTMILRASKKGEKVTTLDGKTHTLPGGDIVIEDGAGRLIDLCGIMGAQNSSIKSSTTTIVLFMQTYSPTHIRKTSMKLAHRTEAAQLFEKGLDSELVLPTVLKGIELVRDLSGGQVASQIYDLYPAPYKDRTVNVTRHKVDAYVGVKLRDEEIKSFLTPLELIPKITKNEIAVSVPSFRPDIKIDVDIIEEIARMYGYHHIAPTLPDTEPPLTIPDLALQKEEEVKIRLRDWGFTEIYSYSMISEELMDQFSLDKAKTYKIANPLSSEWVYMRPAMLPSMLQIIKQNLNTKNDSKLFELSNIYKYRKNDLPEEVPILMIAWVGGKFYEAKGLAESIFELFGIDFVPSQLDATKYTEWNHNKSVQLGDYGVVGEIRSDLLTTIAIKPHVTVLKLNFTKLVASGKTGKQFQPIPKYPPVIEDFSFVLLPKTPIGEVMATIKSVSPLVHTVELLNKYESTVSFRVQYLNPEKPLQDEEVVAIRDLIKKNVAEKCGALLKS